MSPQLPTHFHPKVVAAIDFGTHGTGYAWTTVTTLQDHAGQRDIVYQPFNHFGGNAYPKDLTTVLVDAAGQPLAFGFDARTAWDRALARGNPDNLGYAAGFKIGLQAGGLESGIPRFEGSLAGADRDTVTSLVTATLRRVSGDALAQIERASFTAADIRWCVTVPTIWRDAEQSLMRAAAVAAGLPGDRERLLLVQEPEAAAVYCALHTGSVLEPGRPEGRFDTGAADGGPFMVIDCGGGTVDITSYRLRPEGVGPGRLEETRVADGGRLGSAVVNQAFTDQVLGARFGAAALAKLRADLPREMGEMEKAWEIAKVQLATETDADGRPVVRHDVYVDVPGKVWDVLDDPTRARLTRLADGESHAVVVTADEVTRLFDAVVGEILDLVDRQRAANAADGARGAREQIIVVGGFARSSYLCDAIAHRFGADARVIVPADPAVAVLGGAVHFAYDPSVIWGRRSKYTYGYGCSMTFRPGVDPREKHYVNELHEEMCTGRFGIMVRRGDSVPVDSRKVVTDFGMMPSIVRYTLTLHASYAANPQYLDEDGVEQIGEVLIDMSASAGTTRDRRYAEIAFSFGTTEIEVATKDLLTGRTGRAEVEFHELYGRRRDAARERTED